MTDDYHRVLATHYFDELIKPIDIPAKSNLVYLQKFLSKFNNNASGLKKIKIDN